MTAFNNCHPDILPADEEERPCSDAPQPSSWDSGTSLLDAQKKLHFCQRSCNEEGCKSVEGKGLFSGSSAVCCHCSERLPDTLLYKQEVLCFLNRELEQERIAAESAANEAISMILRLQVEKAALQMEARHYQQVLEAKTLYDEETISQLQAIISSQEADRLVLEREIDECRQTLHKYSEIMTEKGCSGCDDGGYDFPSSTQEIHSRTSSLGSGGSLRPSSLEEKFNHVAGQTMADAQPPEFSSFESRDEAKTKYVVSISTSDPTLKIDQGNSVLEALLVTHGSCFRKHGCQNGALELAGGKIDTRGKCLNDVVKDCWVSIRTQLSNLYNQILKVDSLGISSFEENTRLAWSEDCTCYFRNGSSNMQQEFPMEHSKYGQWADCSPDAYQKENYIRSQTLLSSQNWEFGEGILSRTCALCWDNNNCRPLHQYGETAKARHSSHMDSWCDIMTILDGCIMNLAEKFAACQSQFQALEATRRSVTEALELTKGNRAAAENALVIAADLMRDFLTFTCLGCDILDLLHLLMTSLTALAKLAEGAKSAETYASSKKNSCAIKEGDEKHADDRKDERERISSSAHPDDSGVLQETYSKMSKLAFVWSSSLEWLSNEKCRAETAFSGWDHI